MITFDLNIWNELNDSSKLIAVYSYLTMPEDFKQLLQADTTTQSLDSYNYDVERYRQFTKEISELSKSAMDLYLQQSMEAEEEGGEVVVDVVSYSKVHYFSSNDLVQLKESIYENIVMGGAICNITSIPKAKRSSKFLKKFKRKYLYRVQVIGKVSNDLCYN